MLCSRTVGTTVSYSRDRQYFRHCCPSTYPLLVPVVGAGSENMRVIQLRMRPTPSHSPPNTAMSTQSSSTAPNIYRGANTFQTMRWRCSHAALSALPSSSAPKYSDIPRAARTAARTATLAWLVGGCGSCGDAGRRPGVDEEEVSGITASKRGDVPDSDERHRERNERRGAECVGDHEQG